jgi:hypothetical protein
MGRTPSVKSCPSKLSVRSCPSTDANAACSIRYFHGQLCQDVVLPQSKDCMKSHTIRQFLSVFHHPSSINWIRHQSQDCIKSHTIRQFLSVFRHPLIGSAIRQQSKSCTKPHTVSLILSVICHQSEMDEIGWKNVWCTATISLHLKCKKCLSYHCKYVIHIGHPLVLSLNQPMYSSSTHDNINLNNCIHCALLT